MNDSERKQMLSALEQCFEVCGGASKLADKLGITRQAIDQWRQRGVPAERVVALEAAVAGAVSRRELRPDLFSDSSCCSA